MQANKIITGLLVLLGFSACKPDIDCGGDKGGEGVYMYGPPYAGFEEKYPAPDAEPVETTADLTLELKPEENETE